MLKHRGLLVLVILVLIIAGCSVDSNHQASPDNDVTPPDQNEAHVEQEDEGLDDDQVNEEDETNNETGEDGEDGEEVVEDDIDIAYFMNSNYDIKPIDPETTDDKVVLLTFDDGPKEEDMVADMLDILDKHEAKAIFFVNGFRVENKPELLIQIHERGHMIGNHSWHHLKLGQEPNDVIDENIETVQTIVEELIGERPMFFRPPHASTNSYVKEKVKQEGMLYMHWSNGSLDWDSDYRTTEAIWGSIESQLRPGSNILMHELQWTVDALDTILTRLTEEGYRFVDPRAIHLVQGNHTTEDQSSAQ